MVTEPEDLNSSDIIGAVMESPDVRDRETVAGGSDLVIAEVAAEVGSVITITTIDEVITFASTQCIRTIFSEELVATIASCYVVLIISAIDFVVAATTRKRVISTVSINSI